MSAPALPADLIADIQYFLIQFLDSDTRSRKSVLGVALYGSSFLNTIQWDGAQAPFVRELVRDAVAFGLLDDGTYALCAIVTGAVSDKGSDRRATAAALCDRIHNAYNSFAFSAAASVRESPKLETNMPASAPAASVSSDKPNVFVCYAREDTDIVDVINRYLEPVVREGGVATFQDTKTKFGARWKDQIGDALKTVSAAIVVVSSHSVASSFIQDTEWPALKEAAETRGLKVYWMLLDACRWRTFTGIGDYQAIHDIGKPLRTESEEERKSHFNALADDIESTFPANTKTNP